MPLLIEHVNGEYRPIIVCDYCGKQISDAKHGSYVFGVSAPGERQAITFLHKSCDAALTEDGRRAPLWSPLAALPHYLMRNLNLSATDSEQVALLMIG
jgi:hypothetical protein